MIDKKLGFLKKIFLKKEYRRNTRKVKHVSTYETHFSNRLCLANFLFYKLYTL